MHIFICFKCINIRDVIIYIAASNAWLFERSGLCDRLELIISISETMCTYWPYRRVGRYIGMSVVELRGCAPSLEYTG